jgi:hypothetical protein
MYSFLHCLSGFFFFFLFFLRQASNAHVTPGETCFRGTVNGGLQSNTTKTGQCHKLVAEDTTPYGCPCWVTFTILKLYSPGLREGRARPAEVGPFLRIYFLVKEKEKVEKWI